MVQGRGLNPVRQRGDRLDQVARRKHRDGGARGVVYDVRSVGLRRKKGRGL